MAFTFSLVGCNPCWSIMWSRYCIAGNFRKHLSQYDFEKIFSKILQTMHDKVYNYISYLAILTKYFRKCSTIFEIFEN